MECILPECSNKSKNKRKPALCWSHFQRQRKYGTPYAGARSKRGLFSKKKARILSETQRAYWAGFFDGEGSVGIYVSSGGVITYRCTISQKRPHTGVLRELAEIYDGSITDHKASLCDCLQLSSMRAYEFLRDILPYSVIKKEQIKLFLTTVDAIRLGENPDTLAAVKEISALKKE